MSKLSPLEVRKQQARDLLLMCIGTSAPFLIAIAVMFFDGRIQ